MSNQPSSAPPPTPSTPDTPSNPHNQSTPQDEAPSNANTTISTSEINYILASCTANFRLDGRSNLDHRPYTLSSSSSSSTTNTSPLLLSNGSSRISLPGSTTDILCSIKAELIHPSPLEPNLGIVDLNLDLLPYATTSNDRRSIRNLEMEVASVLNHLLLPHVVHRPSLVVMKGRYVWRLNVDVLVLQCDGNLLDCCSLAIRGAVEDLRLPRVVPVAVEENESLRQSQPQQQSSQGGGGGGKKNVSKDLMLDSDVAHSVRPEGVENCPIVVTVLLLPKFVGDDMGRHCLATLPQRTSNEPTTTGGSSISAIQKVKKRTDSIMIVDASRQEEACASTKVSVSVDPSGRICGVHKYGSSSSTASLTGGGGGGTMPFELLTKVGNVAIATSKRISTLVRGEGGDEVQGVGGKGCGVGASQEYGNLLRGNFELR